MEAKPRPRHQKAYSGPPKPKARLISPAPYRGECFDDHDSLSRYNIDLVYPSLVFIFHRRDFAGLAL
jgi:hypothetical protein